MNLARPKIALITTTIYVPHVLRLYRQFDGEVEFFIAGDRRTPHDEVRGFVRDLPNVHYLSDVDQERMSLRCSEAIGWNSIQRRNVALFAAIRSGADVIVTIDDDNIPLNDQYFAEIGAIYAKPFAGLEVTTDQKAFDVGELLTPKVHHRGFPYDRRGQPITPKMRSVIDVPIGVAAGLWLGDPDIDAMQRITNGPIVHHMSEVLQHGIVVAKDCLTVFNSQNTSFRRELAPLMMMWAGVGRYDDVWASYLCQRIMSGTPYQVHFGKPLVWQERNTQNLWQNLKDEILGMEFTPRLIDDLWSFDLGNGTILDQLKRAYDQIERLDYLPPQVARLGKAWCADLDAVLSKS